MTRFVFFWSGLVCGAIILVIAIWLLFSGTRFTVTEELWFWELGCEDPLLVEYLEQYIEVMRIVVVGVLVALASVFIPLVYSKTKDRFERYKEARSAYSRAKTAVLYLGDRVLKAEFRATELKSQENIGRATNGFELIERAHKELHLAETFSNDIRSQGFIDWYDEPKIWVLHNYWRIVAVAASLRKYEEPSAEKLKGLGNLRETLKETLTIVDKAFGERGGKWKTYEEQEIKIAVNSEGLCFQTKERQRRCRQAKESYLTKEIEGLTGLGTVIGLRKGIGEEATT